MTSRQDGEAAFLALWPTIFVRRQFSDHAEPNREMLDLIRTMERANRNLTTDYKDPDLFNIDHPGVNWLRDGVNRTVIDYLRHIGIDYSVNWQIQGWPNVNRFGDYHDAHNHPRSYLSGTYYLQIPPNREKDRQKMAGRQDLRPGCITFYDPRPGINMNAIKSDPYVDPEFTVQPEPGLLLMWPASINHFVHPNLSKQMRVSISFNIVLKWSDDYLPKQA